MLMVTKGKPLNIYKHITSSAVDSFYSIAISTQTHTKANMKKKAELVFVPSPGMSHIVATTEFAKCFLDRDDRFSITLVIICRPVSTVSERNAMIQSVATSDTRIKCIAIPSVQFESPISSKSAEKLVSFFIEANKSQIEETIVTKILSDDSVQLVGIVLDLFCTSFVDIAHKLNIPSYIYFTFSAVFLGFQLYLPVHHSQVGADQFDPSDAPSLVPTYRKPVPMNVLPDFAFDKDGYTASLYHSMRFKETNGIIINTFDELEPYAISSLAKMTSAPIYPVGPLLGLGTVKEDSKWNDEIVAWLDDQPPSSVVFLCFGTHGCFDDLQLEQIAISLESSHQRFLWSIRRSPPKGSFEMPAEYQNVEEMPLPAGFLERTGKRGKVCGWAPQVEVLAHEAIGGFVSHCGWNSILESMWHGVPIATWPLTGEQQINAFELVEELGLAVDLKMEYRARSEDQVVMADVIEEAIKTLMDIDNPVRIRVKKMSEESRKAVANGGSSAAALGRLIQDFLNQG